jgi:FemAB-related protein (PEP-CTERM system-associated)
VNAPMPIQQTSVRSVNLSDPAECARIDAFVHHAEGATPFHLPRWLKAVEIGCGQRAHMLVAEQEGGISGILPLTEMHSPLFGRALTSSGFAVAGGILSETSGATEELADAGWALAQRLSCPEIELRGGELPRGWQIREGVYANFSKKLEPDPESQLKSIKRRHRAEIRKGLANDLTFEVGRSEHDRERHYRLYATSVRNLGTPVFPRALFDAVLDGFGEDADIAVVSHGGKAVSSVLTLYFNGHAMVYWGGGTFAARALRSNEFLYYSVMNHARDRGCHTFDFGRSKVGTGPYSWKKNWGFEPEPLVYAGKTANGAEPRDINPNSPKYRLQVALWSKLPLPIANRLGPWIAKGLG